MGIGAERLRGGCAVLCGVVDAPAAPFGASTSVFEAMRRLTGFVVEHCDHRSYAADWRRYGEQLFHDVMTSETAKLDALAEN